MNTFFLLVAILCISIQYITKKSYNTRVSNGAFTFSALSSFFASLVFIVFLKGSLSLNKELFPYSLLFALTYGIAQVFSILAVKEGPLSLTSLFAQYSLLIPTFHGLIFLSEPYGITLFLGIGLLVISTVFVNIEKKDNKKITKKWIIFVFISFLGNGLCSVVQKVAGLELSEEYRTSFMLLALLISSVALLIIAFATSKKETLSHITKGGLQYTLSGIANGLTNVATLALATRMSASVSFPIIASGGIILTALVSVFIYREKLSLFQKLGFVLGIGAIIVMNI